MKTLFALVLAILGAALAAIVLAGRAFSAPRYDGAPSDHFDGRRFRNLAPAPHGQGSFLKWIATRERRPWPDRVEFDPAPPPPERVGRGELRVTFVNHATVLIQFDGINVLTDPIWSHRASPLSRLGPRRHHPPGVRFEDLPPLDAILISHNHYDHLDLDTLERLAAREGTPIFVGLGNDRLLEAAGIGPAVALDWWDSKQIGGEVRLHLVPAQHFSSRGLADRDANLWTGFVLENGRDAVYFAGDTGWGPHFDRIRERFPSIRLAILPIGAFQPRWFMAPVHIGPEEALRAHRALAARASMAMHFGTFRLGDDGRTEGPDLLTSLLAAIPAEERPVIWIPRPGETREFR